MEEMVLGNNQNFRNDFSEFIQSVILPVVRDRIALAEDEKSVELKTLYSKMESFLKYLHSWSRDVVFDNYCSTRNSDYSPEITELKRRFDEFKLKDGCQGREQVIEKIMEIEGHILNQILRGNELTW